MIAFEATGRRDLAIALADAFVCAFVCSFVCTFVAGFEAFFGAGLAATPGFFTDVFDAVFAAFARGSAADADVAKASIAAQQSADRIFMTGIPSRTSHGS